MASQSYQPAGRKHHRKSSLGQTYGPRNSLGAWGHHVAPNSPVLDFQAGGAHPGGMGPGVKTGKPPAGNPAQKPPVQPLDPNVVNQQVTANRNIAIGDLYGTWQQGNLDQQYGFGAAGAANPYSEAAKMQESYKRNVLGTTGNFASQGQYNSGAYGRAQNENARNYSIGYDALRRGYDQASGNIQFDRLQRYADAGTGIDEAKFQAVLSALGAL